MEGIWPPTIPKIHVLEIWLIQSNCKKHWLKQKPKVHAIITAGP